VKHLFPFFLLILFACNDPGAPDCFKQAGDPGARTYKLKGLVHHLEVYDLIDVEITDGDDSLIIVEGPENLLNEIEVDFSNGNLNLRNHSTCDFVRDLGIRMKVRVEAPELAKLVYHGQGDVLFRDTLKTPLFVCEIHNGAGDVFIRHSGETSEVYCHTGVSDVYMEGNAFRTSLFHQGMGVFDASAYPANIVNSNNNSINSLYLNSIDYLFALIQSNGNTYYKGNPWQIDEVDQGNGDLIPLN
jgi:hypothetical protein